MRALALADYTPGPELAISFDKSAYQPGETVTISVEPKDNAYHVQQVSGVITEYEGATHSISFAKIGRVFIGTHVLSAGHIAGTDIVSVEAQTLEGITGYSSGTFVVENKSVVLADLSIAGPDIMFSPDMPDEGRMVQIAAQVRNIGQAASGETAGPLPEWHAADRGRSGARLPCARCKRYCFHAVGHARAVGAELYPCCGRP